MVVVLSYHLSYYIMRRSVAVLAVLLMLLVPIQLFADYSDCSSDEQVKLSAVISMGSPEGVAVTNFGDDDVDLKDYSLYDGEGTVVFESHILAAGATLYILSGEPDDRFGDVQYISDGNGCVFTEFKLNNSGDDIYLRKGDVTIDTFCYGSVKATDGWTGDAFEKLDSDMGAYRVSYEDTNTYDDWSTHKISVIHHMISEKGYKAEVEPFVFPDSRGHPVLRTLSETKYKLDISIYNLTHPAIVSILLGLIDDGVDVRILAEGEPVGGISKSAIKALVTLEDAGAEVKVIKFIDNYKRYDHLHSKYAVVDDDKVIITSENWAEGSFTSNRGWGVVVTSEDFAGFYRKVFEEDFWNDKDTVEVREVYPDTPTGSYKCKEKFNESPVTYTATVYPVLSPDNSWNSTKDMISSAEDYVYSEQLNITFSWTKGGDNPLQWMVQSDTDARLLINSSHDDKDNKSSNGAYAVIDKMDGNGVRVRTLENITVHNKGIVSDDLSWVGSVNWTVSSFRFNREAAVIIESQKVADYYKGYFLTDWSGNLSMVNVSVPNDINADEPFKLVMNVSDELEVSWDIDGDGVTDYDGSSVEITLPEGEHEITAYVDSEPVYTTVLTVKTDNDEGGFDTTYVIIGAVGAAVVIGAALILMRVRKS